MVFGSEWMLDKVAAFLNKVEKQALPAINVYYLVCKYALDKQMCRGRDCGTCGGGRCDDAPSLSLSDWPKTASLYRQYKNSRIGRVWPEAMRDVEWAVEHAAYYVNDYRHLSFDQALLSSQKEWPEIPLKWFTIAWGRMRWIESREKLWE